MLAAERLRMDWHGLPALAHADNTPRTARPRSAQVAAVGHALGLDGSYVPRSYIEQVGTVCGGGGGGWGQGAAG